MKCDRLIDQSTLLFSSEVCYQGCAFTVLQTVQRRGVYSAVYGTVHYKITLEVIR